MIFLRSNSTTVKLWGRKGRTKRRCVPTPQWQGEKMFSKRTQWQPGALTLYGLRLPGNEICTTLVTGSYILVRERHTEPALNLFVWLQAKMDDLLSASKSFFMCVPMLLLRPPPGCPPPRHQLSSNQLSLDDKKIILSPYHPFRLCHRHFPRVSMSLFWSLSFTNSRR